MFSEKDLQTLRQLQPLTFDGSLTDDYPQISRNNLRQNLKKGSPRTTLQVVSDSAKGLGYEAYLAKTGLFRQAAPAVENPDAQLEYEIRQKDFWYLDFAVQVKTISSLKGTYAYLSDTMRQKIMQSVDHNDFFVFGLALPDGERDKGCTVFTYSPGFAISSWALKHLLGMLVDSSTPLDVADLYKRPEHFQSLHPELVKMEQ